MKEADLQINIRKTEQAVVKAHHLGFIVSKEGYSPHLKIIENLVQMKPPKDKRQVESFIGRVNFYRKIQKYCSYVLAPLTSLIGDEKFKWKKSIKIHSTKSKL